jgi:capsular exopolysaccharide synthesis family protein
MADEKFELERIPSPEEGSIIRPGYPKLGGYPDAAPYGYGYGYGDDDEKVYLRRMWRAIRKRKWLILVIAVIVTSVVTVEMFRSKSIYQAVTTVEIGKENRTLVRSGDVVVETDESDDVYFVGMGMKTKIRLLQSRPVLEDVVVNLKLDQNPKFLEVNERKSVWEAIKTIGGMVGGQDQGASPQPVAVTPTAPAPTDGTRSRQESARLAPYVDVLMRNLNAEPLSDTRMLVITFTHTDPALAADIVENVAQTFIQRSFESKTEKFTNASDWLERSTRELKGRVEQAEQALADYTRANNLFSMEGKETLATDKLSRFHDQATRAESDRMLKQSLYQEVKAGRVAQLPDAFADPKTAELQKRLGELTTQYAQLDVTYGPKNPKVVEVQQQMAAIQEQINGSRGALEEKLKADYERAVRDEASLKGALEQAKSEAAQQNQAAIKFNILKQDVETAKSLYTEFLQKTNQAKIQRAEQHNSLKIIDPAQVPGAPVGPNRMRTIMIGFFLSLAVGVCLAFFLEYLDSSIKTVEDLSRYAQLPALSVIPAISGRRGRALTSNGNGKRKQLPGIDLPGAEGLKRDKLVALDSRSSAAEAYRVLRTSVLLSAAGSPPKRILITSGQPGEGKTTTCVNTAISLAQLGASVLIIDCDLRKPSAHSAFGVELSRGISTYLSRNTDIDELIQKLPIPNLSLLPCGSIPPNPAELISSTKMKEMLDMLSERYDHILIDSPPLLKVTDPVILSTMVDGVILVVHGGKSTRDIVRRTRQELTSIGAKIFGVVLNNVDLKNDGYNDDYYDRYYSDYAQENSEASGN